MAEHFWPWQVHGKQRVQCWRYSEGQPSTVAYLHLGLLADDRWFIDDTRQKFALAYDTETEARDECARRIAEHPERWSDEPLTPPPASPPPHLLPPPEDPVPE